MIQSALSDHAHRLEILPKIILAGPTASGKSGLAIHIAKSYQGEIVNADASQLYQELSILTARPSDKDMSSIPHHLYGICSGGIIPSVQGWLDMAVSQIKTIEARGNMPIICGGTGLYINALINGINQIPNIPISIRHHIRQSMIDQGPNKLWHQLHDLDSITAQKLNINDSQRIARALEVVLATGKGLSYWHSVNTASPLAGQGKLMKILLLPSRSDLWKNQEHRIYQMMDKGALDEVSALLKQQIPEQNPIMKAIGVPQIQSYLQGKTTQSQMIEQIIIRTRQYSKRQSTWFNHQYQADLILDDLTDNSIKKLSAFLQNNLTK